VVHERAAAAFACGDHHFNPVTIEQANGGLDGRRREHRIDASGQQRHPPATRSFRRIDLADAVDRRRRLSARGEPQHGGDPAKAQEIKHRRERPRDQPGHDSKAEKAHVGQHAHKQPAQRAIDDRTLVGLFDVLPRVVHQMHVVDTGGTRGHAGET